MDDVRIAISLPAHPKTKRLIRQLGDAAGWYLVRLFIWTAAQRPDGRLTGMSGTDIELAIDWPGKPGAFVRALSALRFLDRDGSVYVVHGWNEHNSWAAGKENRSQKARWNAICRHEGPAVADRKVPEYAAKRLRNQADTLGKSAPQGDASSTATSTATSTAPSSATPPRSNAPSPSPSPKMVVDARAPARTRTREGPADPPGGGGGQQQVSRELVEQLRRAGVECAEDSPKLARALAAGATAQALLDAARDYPGKPLGYVVKAALNAARGAATSGGHGHGHGAGRGGAAARRESDAERIERVNAERRQAAAEADGCGAAV